MFTQGLLFKHDPLEGALLPGERCLNDNSIKRAGLNRTTAFN